MKSLLILLLALTAVNISAQQQSPGAAIAPDLKIIESKRYLALSDKPGDADIFKALNDQREALSDKIDPERDRTKLSGPIPAPVISGTNVYVYELQVKNTGQKTIKTIYWKYSFFAPGGPLQPFKEQSCFARKNIEPGKTAKLTFRSRITPPKMAKNEKDRKNLERASIRYIEYTDGSTWKADSQ